MYIAISAEEQKEIAWKQQYENLTSSSTEDRVAANYPSSDLDTPCCYWFNNTTLFKGNSKNLRETEKIILN